MKVQKYCVVKVHRQVYAVAVRDTHREALILAHELAEEWDNKYNSPCKFYVRPCTVNVKIKDIESRRSKQVERKEEEE